MYQYCIKAGLALGADIETQLSACGALRIQNIELDASIGGCSLDSLDGEQVERIRNLLIGNLQRIVLLDCDFSEFSDDRMNLLFRRAMALGVETVNCLPPAGCTMEEFDALLWRLLPIARSYGLVITVENRRASVLSGEEEVGGLLWRHRQANLGVVFNPLEFAAERRHPFFHVFYHCRWKGAIRMLRVNDGLFADGSSMPLLEGNAELKEMVSALLARSFNGYFSFLPEGPAQAAGAIRRFQALLSEI